MKNWHLWIAKFYFSRNFQIYIENKKIETCHFLYWRYKNNNAKYKNSKKVNTEGLLNINIKV